MHLPSSLPRIGPFSDEMRSMSVATDNGLQLSSTHYSSYTMSIYLAGFLCHLLPALIHQ